MLTDLATTLNSDFVPNHSEIDPVIACATDDGYVMPLSAMLYSAGENLRAGSRLQVCILDGGVSEENRLRLKESLVDLPIDLCWISFNTELLEKFHVSHHVTHTAYYRLLLAEVLPASVSRVLYLDCDLLIKGDLLELWETDLDSHLLGAVPDIACPFVDARKGQDNFVNAGPYLATLNPIPNYSELGISPEGLYFNSGVMLIDVDGWRKQRIAARLIDALEKNRDHVWCWDQYALNVVLADRWKPLPLKWNLGSHAFEYPGDHCSPLDRGDFSSMLEDPKIIHFTTEWKPWHYNVKHPYRDEFFSVLDRTSWRNWRPGKPPFRIRRLVDRLMVRLIRQGTIAYRKLVTVRQEAR